MRTGRLPLMSRRGVGLRRDRIDPTSDRPVFKQIADRLRAAIQAGELEPRARMPVSRR